jgi:hypothetical protein
MRYDYCLKHYFTVDEDGTIHVYPSIATRKEHKAESETPITQMQAYKTLQQKRGLVCVYIHQGSTSPFSLEASKSSTVTYRLTDVPQPIYQELTRQAKQNKQSVSSLVLEKIQNALSSGETIRIDRSQTWTEPGKDIRLFDVSPELYSKIKREARRKRIPIRSFILKVLSFAYPGGVVDVE